MEKVHCAFTAREAGQSLVWEKSPLMPMGVEMSKGAVPALLNVTCWIRLGTPTVWLPKLKAVGENTGTGTTPFPLRGTWCGLPGALSGMLRLLLGCPPVTVGLNVTVNVHVVFGAREEGQLLDCVKSLLIEMPEVVISNGAEPVLPKVTVWGALELPTTVSGNIRLDGINDTEGTAITVKATVVVWAGKAPETPLMLIFASPDVAVAVAVKVTTLVEVVGLVLKAGVTPDGNPKADNVTAPVKPPEGVILIVLLPLAPWLIVKLAGDAESEKPSGVAGGNTQLFAALENSSWIV
jgi:hypothetical protein